MYLSWLFLYLFLLSRKVPTLDYSLYFFHDMILNNFVTIHDIIFSYNFYIVNQRILVNGKISVLLSALFSWTITRPKYLRLWHYYKHFFLKIYNLIYIKIDWLFTNQTNRTFLLKLNSYKLQYLYWDKTIDKRLRTACYFVAKRRYKKSMSTDCKQTCIIRLGITDISLSNGVRQWLLFNANSSNGNLCRFE